ncbi:hypothetical protein COLO4_09279 [Corchorus olitorius]|uniref:PA domain-containing protein n=1 Tax=Corchorus olitorius TaxID=93759 RepID=A0A1R3KCP0_9ROSI|nr:hypothetical protein COLO4_09279 [Corchorus olitorius]
MGEKLGLIICVWILLWGNCLGRFIVQKNSLKLTSPMALQGVYESAIGTFGVPQYGGTLFGTIVYPIANQRACKTFDDFGISFKFRPAALPTVLLVDRGDCFLTLKAWNAQKAGAAALLIADHIDEPLITMDTPEDEFPTRYLQNITIPSAFITKALGDSIKKALNNKEMVNMNLDWTESLPHPDERVKYEFWTNSNDECGPKCDSQIEFVKNFKGAAQILEQKGYTQFTPHYITWYCPEAFILSKQCKSQCINHGRYCALDPEQDFSTGYDGKDVVVQNLRQACLFKVANESGKPWLWWDYVTDFAIRCPMKDKKYTKECANEVIKSLGLDVSKIDKCIGDTEYDVDNPILRAEQEAQMGKGSRGDVTILPSLFINNKQYRGNLCKGAILKAICEGFQETTMPAVCFGEGLETDKHLQSNYGAAGWTKNTKRFTQTPFYNKSGQLGTTIHHVKTVRLFSREPDEVTLYVKLLIGLGRVLSFLRPGKMIEKFGFLICAWILLWGNCLARLVVEKNSLKLTWPESIKGIYECSIGNFGVHDQYGKFRTLVGTVVYPKANQVACRNFDEFDISFKSKPGELPTILLVDRGDCYFTLKVWRAQNAGAAGILLVDNWDEPLINMHTIEEEGADVEYLKELNITIPSILISKSLGDSIKKELSNGEMVNINLDLTKSLVEQVKYEFWMNSNYECGPECDNHMKFIINFKETAQIIEQRGYTQFTPHYITWNCLGAFTWSRHCKSQCINHGRYCAPDPQQDYNNGYHGKDVVVENLRQACLFKVANESGMPWLWWDYVTDFAILCSMKENEYNKKCADQVIRSLGIDVSKIDECVGDTEADVKNSVLEDEKDAQIDDGYRGEVTTLPILVINNRQYKGLNKSEFSAFACKFDCMNQLL